MTIEPGPGLESVVTAMAPELEQAPEQFALAVLTERALAQATPPVRLSAEEFRRRPVAIAEPCGV